MYIEKLRNYLLHTKIYCMDNTIEIKTEGKMPHGVLHVCYLCRQTVMAE